MSYKIPTLGGDVTGDPSANTVHSIQGVVISGTPSTGQVLTATSSAAADWQAISSGSVTLAGAVTGAANTNTINLTGNANITGALPSANQAAQTMAGDVTGTTAANTVISITGASGVVNVATTGNIITWNGATTAPGLAQTTTTSGTGADMTIHAQDSTHSSSNGGNLILEAGQGETVSDSMVKIVNQHGTLFQIGNLAGQGGPSGNSIYGCIYPGAVGLTGGNFFLAGTSDGKTLEINAGPGTTGEGTIAMYLDGTSTEAISATTVGGNNVTIYLPLTLNSAPVTWAAATTSPTISQSNNTTASATATNLTIQAQNATGATSIGGNLVLAAGTGTSTNGVVQVKGAGAVVWTLGSDGFGGSALWGGTGDAVNTWALDSSAGQTQLNASSGQSLQFAIGGTDYMSMSSTAFTPTIPITWSAAATPLINQVAATSDVVPTNLTISSQGPYASASTNKAPGNIILNTPAPISGGNAGFVEIQSGTNTGIYLGFDPNGSTTTTGIWMTPNTTPTTSNYTFALVGTVLYMSPLTVNINGNLQVDNGMTVTAGASIFNGSLTLKTNVFNDATTTPVTTTNATLTTIYTDTTIPASTVYDFVVTVVGINTSTQAVYRADFSFTYSRVASAAPLAVGAAATPLNVRTSLDATTDPWGGASIALSGNAVIVQVTGFASTTIDWVCSFNRIMVT